MAKITTSCRIEGSRSTRLNLLGWAMLCPHALELLWHGSTPLSQPLYPTAEESKELHDHIVKLVRDLFIDGRVLALCDKSGGERPCVITDFLEYELRLGFNRDNMQLCANSKADLVYGLNTSHGYMNLYIEVSSTRINPAKPWQALLRAMALYYETMAPVGIIIVSPQRIMYKLFGNEDVKCIYKRIVEGKGQLKPSPNLCSLCELVDYCPYREV